jgi:hypothetical protein
VTVTQSGKWANLYIGYGVKTGGVCFNPTSPQEICGDPEEAVEQPEPTPFNAPPVVQQQVKPEGEGDADQEDPGEVAE